ncbi:MAG: sulfite exporter TauE/SafE family protein [Proteobacteria bacterium]|nr:sulfite exporter TauE/SafE family protein [Pseudomonadota bacterium]
MATLSTSLLLPCLVTGLIAGVASGLFGVGGGIIIVPILVYWFGYSQQTANGTSLVALLLPVGSFAVWNYYRAGRLSGENIQVGLLIGLGIALGAIAGSQLAIGISQDHLKKIFSIFLLAIALKFWFSK